jgi:hypothetical protein
MPDRRAIGCLLVCLALCGAAREALAEDAGDAAWARRAEGMEAGKAPPAATERAIEAYRGNCRLEPARVEACWKLLRALHYLVEFTDAPDARKDAAAGTASELAASWIDAKADDEAPALRDADPRDRAQLAFWSAIAWGARGQRVGLLTIVREGIATRMRDAAQQAVAIDPTIERGGAYRLLSRLHASLPRVPFFTGWVDRDQALPDAERAYAVDPSDPGNRLILALVLLERGPEARRGEAWTLLEQVADHAPRPTLLAEDHAIRERARKELAERRRPDE